MGYRSFGLSGQLVFRLRLRWLHHVVLCPRTLSPWGDGRCNRSRYRSGLTTVDTRRDDRRMSRNTMSFALPESMRAYIDERVRTGGYGNTSEYLRELVRRDQEAQARRRLRELVVEGLESGEGRELTDEVLAELRAQVFDPS